MQKKTIDETEKIWNGMIKSRFATYIMKNENLS